MKISDVCEHGVSKAELCRLCGSAAPATPVAQPGTCSICGDPAPLGACCGGYACTKSSRVAQPEADVMEETPLADAWREWFRRAGEHATAEVVNATATLVIAERKALNERIRANTTTPSTATESPILAFQRWLLRWVEDNNRKLTQTEYGIAYAAFIAAHPGEGPQSHVMGATAVVESMAADIVKAWLWHTHEHDQERARKSIAAIISKYLPARQPAVADLIETCFSQGSNYAELENKPEDCPYADGSLEKHWWARGYAYTYRILRAYKAERKLGAARSDAIGECIQRVLDMGTEWYNAARAKGAAFSDKARLANVFAAALEQLKVSNATKEENRNSSGAPTETNT